jgi:DNA modification methylase
MLTIINSDVMEGLKTLKDESVDCCITSPPYWGLRDYGTAKWEGGNPNCQHKHGGQVEQTVRGSGDLTLGGTGLRPGTDNSYCSLCGARRIDAQIGLEKTPEEYVNKLVEVFREVKRVLKKEGTLWLNLGDSYNGGGRGGRDKNPKYKQSTNLGSTTMPECNMDDSLKPKDLVGIPWRVAFALQSDGWYLRQDIIWSKPNPMPESVTDRCTKSHEYVFLLAKSQKYYYDNEAIKEKALLHKGEVLDNRESGTVLARGLNGQADRQGNFETVGNGRNRRSVWTITTKPFKEAHFATFPEDLVEPMIKAGCPKRNSSRPFCRSRNYRVSSA